MPDVAEGSPRKRLRLLLVEDYFLVAAVYRALLGEMGYEVVGPAASVESALALLQEGEVDGAVLDISLSGTMVTPVAERLQALSRPFVFLTAMRGLEMLPEHLRQAPVAEKPVTTQALQTALAAGGLSSEM